LVTGKTAVDVMLLELARKGLKDVPQMEGVREKLLSKASNFYLDFEKQDPGKSRWQKEIALAQMHVGDMHRALGNYVEADKAYSNSTGKFEDLRRKYPNDPEFQQGLANSLNWWGELWRERQDEKAKEKYELALRLQEQLVMNFASHVDHATYWLELARTHNNLGVIHSNAKSANEAINAFTLAIAMLEPEWNESHSTHDFGPYLKALHPNNYGEGEVLFTRYLSDLKLDMKRVPHPKSSQEVLGWSYNNSAVVLRGENKLREAEANYENASRQWEELLNEERNNRDYKLELAKCQNNLGNLLSNANPAKAIDYNEKAVKNFEQLAAATPPIRRELANSYSSRGAILWTLSREKDSNHETRLIQRSQAAEQYTNAYVHFYQLFETDKDNAEKIDDLGVCVCNMAELKLGLKVSIDGEQISVPSQDDHELTFASHAESSKDLDKLQVLGGRAEAGIYEWAAQIMSRCILLVQADESLSDDNRKKLKGEYAERTRELLQFAIDHGLDKTGLINDNRYQPLREVLPQAIDNLTTSIVPKK
jgi:tetratricopeptide (TPR) repeat protein